MAATDTAPDSLVLPAVDDWHIHLRDGRALERTLKDACGYCHRLVAMPNLNPPLTTVEAADDYRQRLQSALSALNADVLAPEILIPLYLTDATEASQIERAAQADWIPGAKLYPSGATTGSAGGVADLTRLEPTLEVMERAGLPLLIHAEVTDPEVDIFDREAVFLERFAGPWSERFPALRMVIEHLSTATAVDFVSTARDGVAATITAHHLLINRNDLLAGGLKPHNYCLPVAKTEADRKALIGAATGGNPRFFLGTDSAPHARPEKESACGCAGIYSAHAAPELYAEAFDQAGRLDALPAFAGEHGARFYRLPVQPPGTERQLVLKRTPWQVSEQLDYPDGDLVPFAAGRQLNWRRVDS